VLWARTNALNSVASLASIMGAALPSPLMTR
jgi:hypothetical protein